MSATVRKINLEASSVEDAIRRVASELGVPESCLQAKILSEEKSFWGLFGKKLQLEITMNPKSAEPEEPTKSAGHAEYTEKTVKTVKAEKAEKTDKAEKKGKFEVKREDADDSDDIDEADEVNERSRAKLIDESKIFIDELMKRMDLNVTPQTAGSFISLEGEDAAIVVGRYGDTLKAIEYIVNLCIRETKDVPRVRLDSDGYRDRRAANLQRLAASAAKKAAERGIPIRLEPMVSWERRIIHLTLQDSPDVVTESIGESPDRKVVIMPKVNPNDVRTRPRRRSRR